MKLKLYFLCFFLMLVYLVSLVSCGSSKTTQNIIEERNSIPIDTEIEEDSDEILYEIGEEVLDGFPDEAQDVIPDDQEQKVIDKPNESGEPFSLLDYDRPNVSIPKVDHISLLAAGASNIMTQNQLEKEFPIATITYAFKEKIIMPNPMYLRVIVQLDETIINVEKEMRKRIERTKAKEIGKSDTTLVRSVQIAGTDFYSISLQYDKDVFYITAEQNKKQKLSKSGKNFWNWLVKGKKAAVNSEIIIKIKSIDAEGNEYDVDEGSIVMHVEVEEDESALLSDFDDDDESFWAEYKYIFYGGIIALLLAGSVFWFLKRRAAGVLKKVYFSYAWGEENNETVVDKLYISLVDDGFNVVRDKVNLGYKGNISSFMTTIGEGKIIVVALSDKYLKSKFCVFELYEVYRNSKMDKEEFTKKIFPIRVEGINLSDPEVVAEYVNYWKHEEENWTKKIQENGGDSLTAEQANQMQIVKRIVTDLGNILFYLSDINAMDIKTMEQDDFKDIKIALREGMAQIH